MVDTNTIEILLAAKLAELGLNPDTVGSNCEECGVLLSSQEVLNCLVNQDVGAYVCSRHFAEYVESNMASVDASTNENNETLVTCDTVKEEEITMSVATTSAQIAAKRAELLRQIAENDAQEKEIAAIVKVAPGVSGKPQLDKKKAAPATMTEADVSALLPVVSKVVPALHAKLLAVKMAKQADPEYVVKCKSRKADWTPYTGKGLHSHYDEFSVHVAQLASGILDKIATSKGKTNDRKFNFMDGVAICKALCESKVLESHPTSGGFSYYLAGTMPKKDNGASAKVKDTIAELLSGFKF